MNMKKIILIIPAYNESENIEKVVKSITDYNKKNKQIIDYIIINDCSTDNTKEILQKNKFNHINLINNLGIGGAVQTGYKYAFDHGFDIAIQFDGDGQHDVSYVESLIDPIINGNCNMVIGSRFIDDNSSDFQSTFMRRVGIKTISSVIKYKTKTKITDTTSGFRAVDRNIMKQFIQNYPIEYPEPISTTDVLMEGYIVKEVPVNMHERQGGTSSIHSWKNAYYMINVILSILTIRRKRK